MSRLRIRPSHLPLVAAALLPFLLVACSEKSELERVTELRSKYTAELNSFILRQTPLAEPLASPDGEGDLDGGPEPVTPPAGDGEEMAEPEPVPVRNDVVLDIMLRTTAAEALPGVTLDFTHVDAARQQKDRRLIWVDTSGMSRGRPHQITYVVEDIDYSENDGFHVEIRNPIPEGERGDYAELAEANPG